MFSSYLNDLQIRYKLLLLLVFPVTVLMLFTAYGIVQKWHQYGSAQITQNLNKSGLGFSNVIHALQKERGLSAGYLGSKGKNFQAALKSQRITTDQRIQDVLSSNTIAALFNDKEKHLKNRLVDLAGSLEHRHALRNSVDEGLVDAVFEQYSEIVIRAINLIENIGLLTDDAVLARNDQAYTILLWLQEYAGRERGLVNGLLSSEEMGADHISLLTTNMAEQDALLNRFRGVIATARQKARLKELLATPSSIRVQEMRQTLLFQIEKLDLLDRLQIIAGYGGLIHQFKNYVIRGDEAYRVSFIRLYAQVEDALNAFRNIININKAEHAAINAIEATFQAYYLFLPTVEQMRKEGASISQIDQVVRVDDAPAINAIAYLHKGISGIDPVDWFNAATEAINLLKDGSDAIRLESLSYIQQKTSETLLALASYALLAVAVSLLCLYLGVTITRRLAIGATEIAQALQRVEDSGDYSGHIRVEGNDEIAAMGRSFNSLLSGRHAAEKRLHLAFKAFDSTLDGILIMDPEHQIISINRAVTTITGYTENEMLGKTPQMLSSKHNSPDVFRAIWEAIAEKGSWQGDLWNQRKCGEIYPQWQNISAVKNQQGCVVNYISAFSDISALKQTQEQLEYLAHHDPLTGLPNRLLLDQHLSQGLERAYRQKQLMAVLFLDLDHFKNINDSLGHQVGDLLLKQVAQRLKQLIRAEDLIARLGGDEFAIVLESPADERSIGLVAQKCINAFVDPFLVNNNDVYASTSIGISLFPHDGRQADKLIKYADTAMYHAKERGRNAFQFYSRQMTEQAVKRLTLENELRTAIERSDFILYYQPQVSLRSGKIIGAEALVRWQSSKGKLIMPDTFIPVAEETGLIKEIDAWVLQTACLEALRWQSKAQHPIVVAVNMSGVSIEHNQLIERVKNVLHNSGLPPDCLELEITEGYMMQHKEQTAKIISELQELGVHFSIDDFGTGYSSLSYMKSLPIDKLKIDRSFVQEIQHNANDKAIATSVIALGHSMQMEVIAEGVENQQQQDILASLGCDSAQGFFYSEPVVGDEFMELLKNQQ